MPPTAICPCRETFAVALVGQTDAGWLIEADSAEAALDHVRRTADRVKAYSNRGLLVWTEQRYRELYLCNRDWPPGWVRLPSPA